MTDAKFTSAPWIVGDGFSVDGQYLILGNLDDEGGNAHTVVCDINEDPDEWYANARLIAAAPELHECLRGWCEIHSDPEFAAKTDLERAEIRSALWLSSVAALAKAASSQTDDTPQKLTEG